MPAGSLERWPEGYERGRPGWPAEVVDLPGLPPSATVLELGAGIGRRADALGDGGGKLLQRRRVRDPPIAGRIGT